MAFLPAVFPALGSLFGGGAAAAGAATTGIGSALQAAGSIATGLSGLAAGIYQYNVGKMNAELAEQNAVDAAQRAQQEALDQDKQTRAAVGQQIALQGASGLGGRSQMLTRKAARTLGRQDNLNVLEAGRRQAMGFRTDAANARSSGKMGLFEGASSLVSGFVGAGKSLIGGAKNSRMASRFDHWKNMRQVGGLLA